MWQLKAKGLFTKELITAEKLAGKDFLVSKHGDSFHTNVQTAYDAGIPTLLFYEADPEPMINSGLDPDGWSDAGMPDLQNIINDVMVDGLGGVKRAVHGVMIDCSKFSYVATQGNGEKKTIYITAPWISEYGSELLMRTSKRLGLPVYLYMNMNAVTYYKSIGDSVSVETLYRFIASWQGVSTVDWAGVDTAGYPLDTEKPVLPYDDGQPWLFWFYHLNADGMIDVLHQYGKEYLYGEDELNFKAPTTTSPEGEENPSTLPASGEEVLVLKLGAEELALFERAVVAMEGMAKLGV
jgi:hypothetical protein